MSNLMLIIQKQDKNFKKLKSLALAFSNDDLIEVNDKLETKNEACDILAIIKKDYPNKEAEFLAYINNKFKFKKV